MKNYRKFQTVKFSDEKEIVINEKVAILRNNVEVAISLGFSRETVVEKTIATLEKEQYDYQIFCNGLKEMDVISPEMEERNDWFYARGRMLAELTQEK